MLAVKYVLKRFIFQCIVMSINYHLFLGFLHIEKQFIEIEVVSVLENIRIEFEEIAFNTATFRTIQPFSRTTKLCNYDANVLINVNATQCEYGFAEFFYFL